MSGFALPGPAFGHDWTSVGSAEDKLREWVKKGLISLATVFTNKGAAVISNRVIQAGTAPKYGSWGTGSTAAAVTDTDLVTESAETLSGARSVAVETRTTVTNTNDNDLWSYTITATGSRTIQETGLFDAQSSGAGVPNGNGNLNIRSVHSSVGVSTGDAIAYAVGLKYVPN